ncbi:MAG: 4Fe-4S cluster-binding domain-containing protein, partial [Candidatus Methanomethylicia archaeon]
MHILLRPDSITALQDEEVKSRLSWYLMVMNNKRPAKYLICKRIPSEYDEESDINTLWMEHEERAKEFKRIYNEIKDGKLKIEELEKPSKSLLDLKIEIVNRMLEECTFCERKCRVNRRSKTGFCKLNSKTYVSSWFHHWGEEAPLVPSGTIFFSSCNFRCAFCQNYDISQLNPHGGVEVSNIMLAKISTTLRREGVRNINYVGGEPTPNLHTIVSSLRHMDVNVPLLWNSNMYCSEETMKILLDIIDIGLPDFKYGNNNCAKRLSMVENYFEIISRNDKIMHDYPI